MNNVTRTKQIANWLAGSIAILVIILIPLVFVFLNFNYVKGNLDSEVVINSRIISGIINDNPEMWQYQQIRFEEILSRRPQSGEKEIRRIINNHNNLVAESKDDIYPPFIKKSYDLKESGVTVGKIEIYRSWRPLLWKGLIAFIVGALIAVSIFFSINILPFRVLIQAEEALKESESFLNNLLNSIPVPVFYMDTDGRYIGFNKAFEVFFGKTKSELIGKTVFDLNPPELAATYHAKDQELLKTGGLQEYESQVRDAREDTRNVIFNKAVFHDRQGNVSGLIGTILDITERKRSEIERDKLQAALLQSQKMESIGNLAGGIAHDFNNILSAIIGFTELALDDANKGTNLEDNLRELLSAGIRAKDLVKQILTFARESKEKLEPIRVDRVVKEVLQFIRASIPTTIEIKNNIDSDSLIMGSQTQTHQIVMNLCTNAAHAMGDDGGILGISLKDIVVDKGVNGKKLDLENGNYLELSISDTGTGIAPDIVDLIFEPYFTTKEHGKGTGMGLAMVHGIIESYGGKIIVDSTLGEGTTFTIYLPVIQDSKIDHQYEAAQLRSGTERILFVDDEPQIAKMGAQSLERLGYKVTTRTNSIEALELFRTNPKIFDLVITDMTMPKMTGDKLATELLKIRPDIPVILCSGYSKKISAGSAADPGIRAVVDKPILKANLAKTVRKVLDDVKSKSNPIVAT